MSNKREITGWAMYDWANSAFSVTIITLFLGPYLSHLIEISSGETLNFLGYPIYKGSFFLYCISISVGLQVLILPILGTLADYTNLKKPLMLTFAYTGAIATILLGIIDGNIVLLGGLLFIIANLCFGAALVLYNAFLPDIAPTDEHDAVSSKGFAYGYIGSSILLAVNLVMVTFMTDKWLAIRISISSAGVWWLVFTALFPHRRLIQREPLNKLPPNTNYLTHGISEFVASLKEMRLKYPLTLQFLIGYLIYNDGIQTVISTASTFGTDELKIDGSTLALVILMVQFVAAIGAMGCTYVAARIGAKYTVMTTLLIWSGLLIYAYFLMYDASDIWAWAFVVALVLGSSQALSRSMFAKMIPKSREASYFSLYEISERGTSWLGPLVVAFTQDQTHSTRLSILPMIAFFLMGIVILYFTNVRQAIAEAGNEVPAVV